MYLLVGRASSAVVTRWDWHRFIELASIGGWRARSRALRVWMLENHPRPGGRTFLGQDRPSPPGHRVAITARELSAMAQALDAVLLDVPRHDCAAEKALELDDVRQTLRSRWVLPGHELSPLEEFSGQGRQRVIDFSRVLHSLKGCELRHLGDDAETPWWAPRR